MSRHYGTLFQHGYVVPDADAAAHDWAGRMGVGPFFVYPVPIPFQVLKIWGEPVSAQVHKRVLMGYTGPVQIELIEPTDAASPYRDFLERRGAGLQHFGFLCDDFEAQLAAAEARGMIRAIEGHQALSRMCYLCDPADPDAPMIELVDLKPERRQMFDRMRLPSVGWDGRDVIRDL
ncbi:VOC family protein [Paracoccus sp. P2]|uniref:VOC family protein n=1 Tax=Paracoccus TaxID=265 RepID=UPI00046300CE|nr:VOC family protein [Paracoccus pantotrophus]